MADMWEKSYDKATESLEKCAAHGILNGLTYTPKKSYETITCLSTIFSGYIYPTDDYVTLNFSTKSPIELISCQTMAFEKNGYPLFAYYYPSDLSMENEISYEATVTIAKKIEEMIIIDPMTCDVFEVESFDYTYDDYTYTLTLPLKDYPMILTDKKAFEII